VIANPLLTHRPEYEHCYNVSRLQGETAHMATRKKRSATLSETRSFNVLYMRGPV
jgi:hypothetical protein